MSSALLHTSMEKVKQTWKTFFHGATAAHFTQVKIFFMYRNIGVLSGRLLSLKGVNKTFIIWVELSSVMLRDHFVSVFIFLCKGSYSIWVQFIWSRVLRSVLRVAIGLCATLMLWLQRCRASVSEIPLMWGRAAHRGSLSWLVLWSSDGTSGVRFSLCPWPRGILRRIARLIKERGYPQLLNMFNR